MSNSCNPIDSSPPDSSVPGILQARILGWVAISFFNACMHARPFQSCPTLCDSMDSSPPGSPVHGILQARILEWVAISLSHIYFRYSYIWCMYVCTFIIIQCPSFIIDFILKSILFDITLLRFLSCHFCFLEISFSIPLHLVSVCL